MWIWGDLDKVQITTFSICYALSLIFFQVILNSSFSFPSWFEETSRDERWLDIEQVEDEMHMYKFPYTAKKANF